MTESIELISAIQMLGRNLARLAKNGALIRQSRPVEA